MIQKLLGWLRPETAPEPAWQGAPAQPRLKTYTAESGYVYHYYYRGFRETGAGREYRFEYSADRKSWRQLDVVLTAPAGELPDNVRYGVAKISLFDAFDVAENPLELAAQIPVDTAGQMSNLKRLGVEE